ncbi:39S ribosomal protein L38, mitochondrial [Conger conger]|uniref:39S ribosomal protein L38, mitochondrial n=1 Tax=Conger conger TaxID=82655 RepID=UPI002A5A0DEB|nr:39S ribosomal protein L38, mitochondrial [Conger conger]
MACRMVCEAMLRAGLDLGVIQTRGFGTAVALCRRAAPRGPMPNEDIQFTELESLEKYRSYRRYMKTAEEAKKKKVWWRTYRQWLEQERGDRALELVDIGLPHCHTPFSKQIKERRALMKENQRNPELEKDMRHQTFRIPLDRVKAEWERTCGPHQLQTLANHYGIYQDLFPGAHFTPRVMLRIAYGEEASAQVHYGNHVTPAQAATAPHVTFEAEEDSLWTLLLTSPDEHLLDSEGEYVHWLIGNIPGNAVQSGEEVCHYFPPFPAKGTGFHRLVFLLFKQDAPVNFEEDCRSSPCHSLKQRTFKTLEFYRRHQDVITPAGFAFFQCQWDDSVTNTFHALLNMKEPVFEFERPPVYHPPQKKYPHGQPLRYLDRYRDGHKPTYGIY